MKLGSFNNKIIFSRFGFTAPLRGASEFFVLLLVRWLKPPVNRTSPRRSAAIRKMRRVVLLAFAATLLYPSLLLLYHYQPLKAIGIYQNLIWGSKMAGLTGLVGFAGLALFYPPFLENFRLFRQRLMRRMTTDWREIQRLEQLMASGSTPGLAFKLGTAYFQIEDYAHAAPLFEKGITEDPQPPVSALFRLGVCHLRLRQPQKALEPLEKAHGLEPQHASGEILLRLGEAYRLTGDLSSARRFYESYEKYSAGNAEIHYHFGLLHEAEGDRAKARQRMQQALTTYRRMPQKLRRFHGIYAAQARWFLFTHVS